MQYTREHIHEWAYQKNWRGIDCVVCMGISELQPWVELRRHREDLVVYLWEPDPERYLDAMHEVDYGWFRSGRSGAMIESLDVPVCSHRKTLFNSAHTLNRSAVGIGESNTSAIQS